MNDTRIKDHLIKSNQEETANCSRLFLHEISEDQRCFLRYAAWPESTVIASIPLARPLFLPEVTVAFEPGDLEFEIMSPKPRKSKTPQDPNVTFEAKLIESKVRSIGAYVDGILKSCGIKQRKGCVIRAWNLEHIKARAVLPLRDYFKEYCNYLKVSPFQPNPISYRILASLKVLYHILGWECLTPLEIAYFYSVKEVHARKNAVGGFYYLGTYTRDRKIIVRLPNKIEFKEDFF
uniref:Uncharacterized protein n=1 Tax=Cannabis sativa TaxID=3483 RepID=A0A803PSI0_CANSA